MVSLLYGVQYALHGIARHQVHGGFRHPERLGYCGAGDLPSVRWGWVLQLATELRTLRKPADTC